jgi:hypothetical protein
LPEANCGTEATQRCLYLKKNIAALLSPTESKSIYTKQKQPPFDGHRFIELKE